MTKAREEVCDFSFPIMVDYWTILLPVIIQNNLWAIFNPFGLETWALAAFTVLVFAVGATTPSMVNFY